MKNIPLDYRVYQIGLVQDAYDKTPNVDCIRITISYNGATTKTLNISRQELCQIKNVLC